MGDADDLRWVDISEKDYTVAERSFRLLHTDEDKSAALIRLQTKLSTATRNYYRTWPDKGVMSPEQPIPEELLDPGKLDDLKRYVETIWRLQR